MGQHHRRSGRPKIAELLAAPAAAGVVRELRECRRLAVPPTKFRQRAPVTHYYYDDPAHPTKITSSTTSPEWLEEDRALLLGLAAYEDTLCPGCGQPRHLAWHKHTEDEWEGNLFVCHACTAKTGSGKQRQEITYSRLEFVMPPDRVARMPDFDMGQTTKPTEPPAGGSGP